ncbi:hypothetical protein AAFF_G00416090 [Aldrovandia affinis]|uniref:Uncharacterized protein n=1 Tax=Aldrovandia affinis TaxID=143900 RepID=A0AAD7VYX8_9TELE|nr:hypothetical protein AAFF_G00416090 [Aldrovandia affinis]
MEKNSMPEKKEDDDPEVANEESEGEGGRHVVGKHVTDGIFQQTGLSHLRDGHVADYVGFNGHRTKVWGELRRLYPDKLDPSKLEGEELKEGESVPKFLHTFQRRWREETGSPWNANDTTRNLFKLMLKRACPNLCKSAWMR